MKTINTTLTTTALFSEDETKRYLLRKEWDSSKPSLAIIMLAPSEASGIVLDNTTLLVLNNASRLGYGSVSVVNLFATLNDFNLSSSENEDTENMKVILDEAEKCDIVVYSPGVGKAKNHNFQTRSSQVLSQLKPFEKKLHCITNKDGNIKFVHPLTPCVREWSMTKFKIGEILGTGDSLEPIGKKQSSKK